jgi:hypothetical protein
MEFKVVLEIRIDNPDLESKKAVSFENHINSTLVFLCENFGICCEKSYFSYYDSDVSLIQGIRLMGIKYKFIVQ